MCRAKINPKNALATMPYAITGAASRARIVHASVTGVAEEEGMDISRLIEARIARIAVFFVSWGKIIVKFV